MIRLPLTQHELDDLQCQNPACEHEVCKLVLVALCHPDGVSVVIYDKNRGVLTVQCRVCTRIIAEIAVAS